MTISLRYAARSDVGLVRANNQDSAYAGPNLLVVADGMGGHAGGDVASRIAIASLRELDTHTHAPDTALADLEAAVESARRDLVRASAAEPSLSGMGTTVTALLRTGSALVMAHMGDSRAYLLRDGALTQVTVDHTFVQHLVDTGRISPDEAEHHPQRNVVMRVLSDFDLDLHPDMSIREAKAGDRWLLCSDGLSGFVHADLIGEILTDATDPGEAADQLLLAAMRGQSTDNVTAIVADVVIDGDDDGQDAEAVVDDDAAGPGVPTAAQAGVGGIQVVGAAEDSGPIPGLAGSAQGDAAADDAGHDDAGHDDAGHDDVGPGDDPSAGARANQPHANQPPTNQPPTNQPGDGAASPAGPVDDEGRAPGGHDDAAEDLSDDPNSDDPNSADPDSDDPDSDDPDGDDPGARPPSRRRPVIATLVTLAVLAVIGLGAWGGYAWTQRQYFVGVSDGRVAVFRGLPASAGPLTLSHPVELTDTYIADLPAFFAARLDGTIRASSREDARARAQRLIDQALPEPAPTTSPAPAPTTASPTATPTATPAGTPTATPAGPAE